MSAPSDTPPVAAPGAPRRATITDVAREARTGKTSISRYLNGEMGVMSPELRARIEAAIARLDYQPNQMARGLKRGRNRLIGMLIADLTNPYSVEVLQGVEAACHALGLMPLICHAANEVEMERRYLQLLTTYRVEGVIVNALGAREETLRPVVGGGGIPAVLVDRMVDGLAADMVGLDNRAAAELGTRHLLEQGFDDIWFVVQPFEQVSSRQLRESAFRDAMRAQPAARAHTLVLDLADQEAVELGLAGLDRALDAMDGGGVRAEPADDEQALAAGLARTAATPSAKGEPEGAGQAAQQAAGPTAQQAAGQRAALAAAPAAAGEAARTVGQAAAAAAPKASTHAVAVGQTAEQAPTKPPTKATTKATTKAPSKPPSKAPTRPAPRVALFAANAPVALRLALHLKARYGAAWQTRVALLAIDDPEWAELAGITTIRQPTYEIGYRAVEFLHERIEGAQSGARDCLLAGELIVRASTSR